MRNNLVRDPAGVAADARRIKDNRVMISPRFRRVESVRVGEWSVSSA
jgi:hypothetical protein